ncbi:hypothetical protein E2C01_038270 [Portunus trituberculatus]|uniref:Uncharacterized protein n=1 Tax=Portunus trituberculatus TaxID=210409 RepID=A0A5B7FHK0_PORTR|nr:hypothetical protein [Portunus trituberculatus]
MEETWAQRRCANADCLGVGRVRHRYANHHNTSTPPRKKRETSLLLHQRPTFGVTSNVHVPETSCQSGRGTWKNNDSLVEVCPESVKPRCDVSASKPNQWRAVKGEVAVEVAAVVVVVVAAAWCLASLQACGDSWLLMGGGRKTQL